MSYLTPEERREARSAFWYVLGWVVAIIVIVSLISAALWGLGVFTSGIKGRGDAVRIKNGAVNRIAASERFEERYQDIQAASQRIATMQSALRESPYDETAKVNATGSITYCQQAVAEYNADARKYTSAQFRAADLPESIDASSTCTSNGASQ